MSAATDFATFMNELGSKKGVLKETKASNIVFSLRRLKFTGDKLQSLMMKSLEPEGFTEDEISLASAWLEEHL